MIIYLKYNHNYIINFIFIIKFCSCFNFFLVFAWSTFYQKPEKKKFHYII